MARVDVEEYRRMYLKEVQDRIIDKKDSMPNYTSRLLNDAILAELNRADEDTWEIEVPDNREQAMKEAEERIIETMKHHKDLGVGKTF